MHQSVLSLFGWNKELSFFFFFFSCQASAARTHRSWYSEQNQGICIIHYSRCGTVRRHKCPGHWGRTSMSKKPKVNKKKDENQHMTCCYFSVKQRYTTRSFHYWLWRCLVSWVLCVRWSLRAVCNDIMVPQSILPLASFHSLHCQKCIGFKLMLYLL